MIRDSSSKYMSSSSGDEGIVQDTEMLLTAIRDYTRQLRESSEKRQAQWQILATGVSAIAIFLAVAIPILGADVVDNFRRMSPAGQVASLASVFLGLAGIVVAFGTTYRRVVSHQYETERLELSLERLVRRASQLLDKGKAPFSQQVMMDVTLSDAEFALRWTIREEPILSRLSHLIMRMFRHSSG